MSFRETLLFSLGSGRSCALHAALGSLWLLMPTLCHADSAVNTFTTGTQNAAAITADGQGRFIIVWQSDGQDGDGFGVFGRRLDSSGRPVGDEFRVNTYTTGGQSTPAVAADTAGNFIVVWRGEAGGNRSDVLAQRFDASGATVGGEIQLNQDTSLDQTTPTVALADDGSFLAMWSNQQRLVTRRFDDLSIPTTDDFELARNDPMYPNYGETSFHMRDAEALANGNFVVVWQQSYYANSGYSYTDQIRGAVFNDLGTLDTVVEISSSAPAEQHRGPHMAATADGGFVTVWGGYTYYAVYSQILGRRFSADGTPVGGFFDPTPADELAVTPTDVAAVGADRFLVVWTDPEVEGRFVGADGTPIGDELRINTDVAGIERRPVVASAEGNPLVVWAEDAGGDFGNEVRASNRRLFFADGFESGDTSGWTTTVPGF